MSYNDGIPTWAQAPVSSNDGIPVVSSPLHSASTMATAIANDPSLVGVAQPAYSAAPITAAGDWTKNVAPEWQNAVLVNAEGRPTVAGLAAAAGISRDQLGNTDALRSVSDAIYGDIGSNVDARDWGKIMQADNPLAAARLATVDMYKDPTYQGSNLTNLSGKGYGSDIADYTYGMVTDRINQSLADPNLRAYYQAPAPQPASQSTTSTGSGFEQMVRDAYGSIGRTGIGTEASNIDQAGFDYWLNTLKTGQSTPEAFQKNFETGVFDYLGKNPEDQYSTYVADYLQKNNNPEIAGVQQLYRDVLGRDAEAGGLSNWYQQFGSEISPEERAAFETSAKAELDSRVRGLYTDFLGREAETEGVDYWRKQFGSSIDDTEREQFRQSAAAEINKAFGAEGGAAVYFNQNPDVAAAYAKDSMGMSPQEFAEAHYAKYGSNEGRTDLNTAGILSGFKYANDLGLTEAGMKKTLGEDVFNTYKDGFADYAKTGIANILADNQLSFDEARTAMKFSRDYGYDAQKMADLTGTDKRVFDAINEGYETGTKKIVNAVLGAEDVKTDTDRAIRSLALQNKFGFTDEDLAKATGYDAAKLKSDLDPIRNFGADLNKILTNTDSTLAETKNFLDKAKTNGAISQLYGTNLGVLDTKIAEIEDRWKDFKDVDPMQAQRVFDQLGQQREKLGDQYYRGVFGDPLTMAATLARKGIDTLADIVQKDKFETVQAERSTGPDGKPVFTHPYDWEAGGYPPLSAEEAATLKADGSFQRKVGSVAIDKDTGREIAGPSGEIAYQSSSGGLNKKHNHLNVTFTKEGVPVLTANSARAGLGALIQDLAPMISMALPFVLPGLGTALSGMLPGAAVAASGAAAAIPASLLNQALTQGIISGGLTTLGGGQFEKGFLSGAVNPVVRTGISNILPTGMNPDISRAVVNAGTGAVRGAIQGGDFSDILKGGITQGLTDYGVNTALGASGLTPQQLNFVTGIAAPLLQGDKITPSKVFGTIVNTNEQMQRTRP